jgi:hypothetical protein
MRKRTISIIIAIIVITICYKFNQKDLALGLAIYVAGCVTMYCVKLIPHKFVPDIEEEFDDEFNSYEEFIHSSSDELWLKFVEEADVEEDFTTLSDDRKMFYQEHIEKYSHLLDKDLKQNSTNL